MLRELSRRFRGDGWAWRVGRTDSACGIEETEACSAGLDRVKAGSAEIELVSTRSGEVRPCAEVD